MYSQTLHPRNVITPAVLDADTESAAIDLQGHYAASFLISVGAGGITFTATNKLEFLLLHSDDNATYSAVDASDVDKVTAVGTNGEVLTFISAHAAAGSYIVNYVGGRRYVKLKADFSGTHAAGTAISAVVALGHPMLASAA
ncbi:MAG: hypothetical protein AAFQ22_00495 [Pseudomonadota bacterium]